MRAVTLRTVYWDPRAGAPGARLGARKSPLRAFVAILHLGALAAYDWLSQPTVLSTFFDSQSGRVTLETRTPLETKIAHETPEVRACRDTGDHGRFSWPFRRTFAPREIASKLWQGP